MSITADYDPFVASQDPCGHYQARDARDVSGALRVSVFPVCDGTTAAKPIVLAEVAATAGDMRIVNFRNPEDPTSDLQRDLAKTGADSTHRRPN